MKAIFIMDKTGGFAKADREIFDWDMDKAHFRSFIKNQNIIMGGKTFELLPKSVLFLPKKVFVLTSRISGVVDDPQHIHLKFIKSMNDVDLIESTNSYDDLICIGGAALITSLFLNNLFDEMYITLVDGNLDADIYVTRKIAEIFEDGVIHPWKKELCIHRDITYDCEYALSIYHLINMERVDDE